MAVAVAVAVAVASLGSCFPTTLYIGHPGWKVMGAHLGYAWLNGVVLDLAARPGVSALAIRP